jgi:tripartite ATP-independent transporter DctM subunit
MDTQSLATLILVGSFLIMIVLRFPIAFAIGISTAGTIVYLGLPLQQLVQNMVGGVNKFTLMAVPFFIIAGEIMGAGGISNRLIRLSNALVGWLRGGLAMVNILASMFFGGISGSSTADTASIGSIMIPMMEKQGYDSEFSTNVTMASSVQGLLIPPSHNMVIFAMVAGGVSVGRLFLAGMIPGIFLGIALMIYSFFVSIKRKYPKGDPLSFKNIIAALKDSILGLFTVVIVVVGVVGGIFTATESAAIAVVYAFFITFFVYREIPLNNFWKILERSINTLSIVLILIALSTAFGWVLSYLRIPALVAQFILSVTSSKILILMMLNVMLLLLGMIMDMSSIILISSPILLPVVLQLGMDPVHFGVILVFNLGIGLITPPVGGTLFIGSAISGVKIERLAKTMMPFYLVMIFVLIIVTYVPGAVMAIPNLIMPTK